MSSHQQSLEESAESGFEDLSMSLSLEIEAHRTAPQKLEDKLSATVQERYRVPARVRSNEEELKKKLKAKEEKLERDMLRLQEQTQRFEREIKFWKRRFEEVGFEKEKVKAKGKESELALKKLSRIPLEDDLKRERRRADREEKMRREVEKHNCQLQATLDNMKKQQAIERRESEEIRKKIASRI